MKIARETIETVRFGATDRHDFTFPQRMSVGVYGVAHQGDQANDTSCPYEQGIASPIAPMPPISEMAIGTSSVTVVVQTGLTDVERACRALLMPLLAGGVDPNQITILRTQTEARLSPIDPRDGLPLAARRDVQLVTHDAGDLRQLAYLASTADGHRIYVNRHLADADIVLPICMAEPRWPREMRNVHRCWFPAFSESRHSVTFPDIANGTYTGTIGGPTKTIARDRLATRPPICRDRRTGWLRPATRPRRDRTDR